MTDNDSDDDAQLQAAIALSLQTQSSPPDRQSVQLIDLVSTDDDDDDLERVSGTNHPPALRGETSKQSSARDPYQSDMSIAKVNGENNASTDKGIRQTETSSNTVGSDQGVSQPSVLASGGDTSSPRPIPGLAGLDRRKMEEERLLRLQQKRQRDISPPQFRDGKRPKLSSLSTSSQNEGSVSKPDVETKLMQSRPVSLSEAISRRPPNESSKATTSRASETSEVASNEQRRTALSSNIQFPDGVVKKTWAYGYPRDNDIKIEEVLQKNDLDLAVLSAFQWDEEWILSKLDMKKTRVICVVQAKTEEEKRIMRANVPPNIQFCFPSMEGQINCMHSKLQLLSHPTHLRVVVPSANLVPYDWGETGVMENMVFLIDLPRWQDGRSSTLEELTPFGRELRNFLKAMGMIQSVVDSMLKFDFSRTKSFAFVHTIGGSHSGEDWKHTGYCGLSSAVRELGLASEDPVEVDFVTASVGFLNRDFLKSIYLAAKGIEDYSTSPSITAEELESNFRIYFPSKDTVTGSRGGRQSGGTICFQSRWYDSPKFPQSAMRDCKSQRPRMLMHNKILFVRPSGLRPFLGKNAAAYAAWAYIGSANLSESAWGRLVKDRSSKLPKLNCRNWECGVVVPVPLPESASSATSASRSTENVSMDVFGNVVPLPMVVPGDRYAGKRPWFYLEDQ